ncbi:uncharacterized protein PADG_12459 [Paracoccidioides brasiliensis Pb18]|uniref:Uncharacterized protein n=1 Tax=Paracoccidioides brasiliensis (strain Pb18) TaxID=502780 RepID=A0A0A0HSZ5_PARBD|nr:uncharacterized protein PADG_12459 [Paracoccidioides brasiliensis Pb18]KGM91438.1 hypothetical protein PADG_12459 [Paracoccidioides brasiliensis Pb18]
MSEWEDEKKLYRLFYFSVNVGYIVVPTRSLPTPVNVLGFSSATISSSPSQKRPLVVVDLEFSQHFQVTLNMYPHIYQFTGTNPGRQSKAKNKSKNKNKKSNTRSHDVSVDAMDSSLRTRFGRIPWVNLSLSTRKVHDPQPLASFLTAKVNLFVVADTFQPAEWPAAFEQLVPLLMCSFAKPGTCPSDGCLYDFCQPDPSGLRLLLCDI